jgi:aspartate kinase
MGKTTNALEVIKDYLKSSALQSSVQEVKKYHNQVLLDLFEDDTNVLLQSKRSLLILTIF